MTELVSQFLLDLALLLRLVSPCNIINNEVGKKIFGSLDLSSFKDLFFLRYLDVPKFSESKRLVYELLTIYLTENPLITVESLFEKEQNKEKYLKWLLIDKPETHSRLLSYSQQQVS